MRSVTRSALFLNSWTAPGKLLSRGSLLIFTSENPASFISEVMLETKCNHRSDGLVNALLNGPASNAPGTLVISFAIHAQNLLNHLPMQLSMKWPPGLQSLPI